MKNKQTNKQTNKKNLSANAEDIRDTGLIPGLGRSLGEGMQPTPVLLPGESHG